MADRNWEMNRLDTRLYRFPLWRKLRGLPEPILVPYHLLAREALRLAHEKMALIGGTIKTGTANGRQTD